MNNQNSSDSEQTKLCFIAIAKLSLINPAGTDKYAYALREIIDQRNKELIDEIDMNKFIERAQILN